MPNSDTVTLDQAQRWILDRVSPLTPRRVRLAEAVGLVLASDAVAVAASPPFDTAAVDGYAVRFDGASRRFTVRVGPRSADVPGARLERGEAVRISGGAQVLASADAVVALDDVTERGRHIVVRLDVDPLHNVRGAGDDHRLGAVVVEQWTRLRPAHVALLATAGHDDALVIPRPRVGVLAVPDRSGSRSPTSSGLLALVARSGHIPVDLGVAGDDEPSVDDTLRRAGCDCDAVITHDGASGSWRRMRVAMRPATALACAATGTVPAIALPDDPASAVVAFELFARPALDRLAGLADPARRRAFTGAATADFVRHTDGTVHVVPVVDDVTADGRVVVRPATRSHRSHITAVARATALALLPDGPTVAAGTLLRCVRI
jgi:molybdopterin molybdotransferase